MLKVEKMKIAIIILLSFCNIWANGQNTISIRDVIKQEQIAARTNTKQNSIGADTTKLKIDTLNLSLEINEELSTPIDLNRPTKIILIKEKSKYDFFQYLLPILTLLLGIWIKELLDRNNNKKKIKKMGQRWVAELRSLEEPLRKQTEALKDFLTEHKKEEFSIPKISLYSSLNGEVFKSLDKNELIQYIESKYRKSEYKDIVKISNKTHGYISILVNLYSNLKEKFDKYLSQTSFYVEALNKNLQSFNVAFAEYGVEIEKEIKTEPINDQRYKPIVDLYSTFILPHMEDGKFNPFILQTDFFLPVISHLSKYRLEPITKPLLVASNEALNNIKGIKMEKYYMTEIINTMIVRYDDLLKDINDIVNAIEKHKA